MPLLWALAQGAPFAFSLARIRIRVQQTREGVVVLKERTNIVDLLVVRKKRRPPYKLKQGNFEKAVRKIRERKMKTKP